MQSSPSLFSRHDTFFGVCEGLGQDFGFNPNYLRVAFAVSLLLSPLAVLGVYGALGVVVALSRWFVPAGQLRKPGVAAPAPMALHHSDDEPVALAIAA